MTRASAKKIEGMARKQGFMDFKWVNPKQIITGQWVRMKCMYGCKSFGQRGCCPPEVPSVEDCRRFFDEYRWGLFLHFPIQHEKPEDRFPWGVEMTRKGHALEREVFLADFPKAYVFPPAPCRLCENCPGTKKDCYHPMMARPSLEAFGVDVYGTARKFGFSIHVVPDYDRAMDRFGLLLVE